MALGQSRQIEIEDVENGAVQIPDLAPLMGLARKGVVVPHEETEVVDHSPQMRVPGFQRAEKRPNRFVQASALVRELPAGFRKLRLFAFSAGDGKQVVNVVVPAAVRPGIVAARRIVKRFAGMIGRILLQNRQGRAPAFGPELVDGLLLRLGTVQTAQSWIARPGTRPKWSTLCVTTGHPSARADAAMSVSMLPMGVPADSSATRRSA